MKSYFYKYRDVKIRLMKCDKKTHVAIGCKRGKLKCELIIAISLTDRNILVHKLGDGWTRWVACVYSGAAKRQTQNSKA